MADVQKQLLRTLVDNVYDVQATRIAMGNRLVASLRELGIIVAEDPSGVNVAPQKKGAKHTVDEDAGGGKDNEENNKLLVKVIDEYKKVSTVYAEKFGSRGSINKALNIVGAENTYVQTELTYSMVALFVRMLDSEQKMLDICAKEVKKHPMWDAFFKDVKGCGPLMSAVCIAYFDPHKARWPSSFWKYAGLDVVVDDRGSHGRSRSDTVLVKYLNKQGEETEKKSLTYNPVVKTKLIGVLGTSFLRSGRDSKYARIYYDYKNRLQNRADCKDLRAVVIHRRAIRYAVKMFLKDMWNVWRELEGLPIGPDYAEEKLGRDPHHDPRDGVSDDVLRAAGVSAMSLGD